MIMCFRIYQEANLAFRIIIYNDKYHLPSGDGNKKQRRGYSAPVLCPIVACGHSRVLTELLVEV